MTLLTNLATRTANSPSTFANNDRATAKSRKVELSNMPNKILATSAAAAVAPTISVQSLQAKLLAARKKNELLEEIERGVDKDGYPFCEYRKGFWDHLQGKAIIISTLRVSLQQATTILVSFISEQLDLDLKRNVKVNEGELTQLEADLEAEEWEKIEWERRWKTFPHKFLTALVKYHAVTLILRSYEYIASKIVNLRKLDKLTTDPFAISKRVANKLNDKKSPSASKKLTTGEKVTVYFSMTQTALWANLLPFFADYSLHQGLLCYGYYKFYSYKRQKRIAERLETSPADPDEQDSMILLDAAADREDQTVLLKDLGIKSQRLAANRGLGWFGSSVGAGLGSVVWPGWGTILVSSLGDVAAGTLLDDGYYKARANLEEQERDMETKDAIHKAQVQ